MQFSRRVEIVTGSSQYSKYWVCPAGSPGAGIESFKTEKEARDYIESEGWTCVGSYMDSD